ncbi:MAG: FHA domain-containing protein [Lachnospiraceae bacterium]|nr:FHA domain-containing protein [Lachnospiraceae bacterium]
MEIKYERKANQSFMVMEGEPCDLGYEEQMLRQNEVKILLSFYTIEINRHIEYWHDITGKQSLRDYLEREGLTPEILNQIVLYLGIAYEELTKYLISQQHIYVTADTVFVEQEGRDIALFFCYRPYRNMAVQEQLISLWEFFLTIVDHKMEEFVKLCYELYDVITRGNFTMEGIQERIQEFSQSQNSLPKPNIEQPYVEKVELKRKETEDNDMLEELEIEDESKENMDVFQILRDAFQTMWKHIQILKEKNKVKFIPEQEAEDDYIYDPEEDYSRPTVLLHGGEDLCVGKLLYEGSGEEEDIIINKDIFRIGSRDTDNDAVLHSSGVSRHHARILKQGDSYFLEDLNSTNGTFVNGKQLNYKEKLKLEIMDQIRFADALYRVV